MNLSSLLLVIASAAASTADTAPTAPYAGQEEREIKALAPAEIEGLLAGKGLGFGKAAELNRYPGPAHVLELASELKLTDAQLQATRQIHARMQARAKALGAQLVDAEAQLERLFRSESITEAGLAAALEPIGELLAKLRGVHLNAHIEQRKLLSAEQIAHYVHLRGYQKGDGASQHAH